MRRRRVAIVDLLEKGPSNSLWARAMQPNFASIMPQVIGVWCEQAGHDVTLVCYTGREDLARELPADTDLVFIASYTQTAHLAYALANIYRQRGTVTALGGSHARCYPHDAARYFDYVLGFTDRAIVDEVLRDCAPHRPTGLSLSAKRQPAQLPGVRERWKFIEPTIAKAAAIKIVPMIGSLGCPYTCSFCIDAAVDYQPLDRDQIRDVFKKVKDEFGKIDILINNAATLDHAAQIPNQSYELWDRDVRVNLTGAFNCTKEVWPYLVENKFGRLIFMSSIAGTLGGFGQASYSSTKAALIGLAKTAALEGGRHNITSNAIAPGIIESEAGKAAADTNPLYERFKARTVFKRFGQPEDIANTIAFLCSNEAGYITGAVIEVAGGIPLFTA